ncbi:cytochrome-c peroxidase [Novilysobacter spongiicola]|uniref:Cytochrome c peroxidase n=1 Tax=Lysobacter spongiicola DSM 21749 TaxID=1122188 RepID=A0A1T4MAW0_9GAMM|nr:cytochrome c peroxidase [Lysobacter spongiicola DSM 21749]
MERSRVVLDHSSPFRAPAARALALAVAAVLALAGCSEREPPAGGSGAGEAAGEQAPGVDSAGVAANAPASAAEGEVLPPAGSAVSAAGGELPGEPADELMAQARAIFKPIPARAEDPEGNPVTEEKVALGRQLWFDGRLSSSGVISCNTCHNVGMGGVDGVPTSIGHGFQKGPRNAPTVYNAVFNVAQFWDGRAEDLKAQAKGPIEAAVEMNARPEDVVATLESIPGYVEGFDRAFPGESGSLSYDNIARAIEAFEVTLVTPDAPFDRYLRGDADALDDAARRGLSTFIGKGCAACHNGVNVGGGAYFPFGVVERPGAELLPPGDRGRFDVTKTATDEYVFRASPLRNVALTAPYFHTGQVWSLTEAVEIMGSSQLGAELTAAEVGDIVSFLHALTGEVPEIEYPQLPMRSDDTPPPSGF